MKYLALVCLTTSLFAQSFPVPEGCCGLVGDRCIHGPFYLSFAGGSSISIPPEGRVCVPPDDGSPIHLSIWPNGSMMIWDDDGHVYPLIAFGGGRENVKEFNHGVH
jgi:hypothetical protein